MKKYTLLYRDSTLLPADAPIVFQCHADNCEHAEEQLHNAYDSAEVVWIESGHNIEYCWYTYYNCL